ncbi:MAG: FtsX-like permease family protein [Acetatifactor sp.]|nr:FtsX-like permease family protein [Acetatifactor sp.]
MITLIFQKLVHKKWMVLCLLIGNILLVAVAVSYPLYRNSSFQRMLTDEFEQYAEKTGEWPAIWGVSHSRSRGKDGVSYKQLADYVDRCQAQLNVPLYQEIEYLSTSLNNVEPVVEREERLERRLQISAISDLEEEILIYAGRLPERELAEDGCLEVMVGNVVADTMNILLDEAYQFENLLWADGSPVRFRVVGMYRPVNESSPFWVEEPFGMHRDVFVPMEAFRTYFLGEEQEFAFGCKKRIYQLWDYSAIEPQQIRDILQTSRRLVDAERNGSLILDNVYENIIENYSAKAKRVEASLLILQMPVLALLLAFIYMISSQMLTMEQSEISVMKSRGAKRRQILQMYLVQNLFLGLISLAAGLPLGGVFCSALGTATDFMEFSGRRTLNVSWSVDVLWYAGAALLLMMVMTLIPVIGFSRISIVNLKQSQAKKKRSLWKKIYLDVISLAVALYGYYSFSRNQQQMMEQVISGETLDPLLYLSSSLFLLGCGLLALRLQPLLLRLLFRIGKKRMTPASYVAFVDGIRGAQKKEFIMLFMILTVALGIHNITVARTIVANAEKNDAYATGADLVLKEVWKDNSAMVPAGESITYVEPDYGKYGTIPDMATHTRVLNMRISINRKSPDMQLMGIITNEFAEIALMPEGLLPYDFYDYLNVLAASANSVLVSENFMTKLDYHLGDIIAIPDRKDGSIRLKIRGFFNYWPSYSPYTYRLNNDGILQQEDNYLIVANLAMLEQEQGKVPYEIWFKAGDTTEGIYTWLEENPGVKLTKFVDLEEVKEESRSDTLFQGTNGILTMSFIVVLLLCGVGYLIYFILAIRSRELLFGVLRAMGMKKGEISRMLVLEQIFCGLYSILMGTGIGLVGSQMFVPMIQNAYAASDQVLPLELITNRNDLLQLFGIIGVVVLVCLLVISRIVAHMNISKALKLGED